MSLINLCRGSLVAALPTPLASPLFPWINASEHFSSRFSAQRDLVLAYHAVRYNPRARVQIWDDALIDLQFAAIKLKELAEILSTDAIADPDKAKSIANQIPLYPGVACEVDEKTQALCVKATGGQPLMLCSRVSLDIIFRL